MIVAESGRRAEGTREIERIRRIAVDARDLTYVCIADQCRGRLAIYRGVPSEALAHARAAFEIAERLDAPGFRVYARLFTGAAHLLEQNYDEAIAAIREAKTIATPEMIGPNQYLVILARLAEACLGKGDYQRALELSAEAIKRAEGNRRLGAVEAHQARARVLIATSAEREVDEIIRLLDHAAAIADRCGGKVYEPAIHESRAALAGAIARPEEAERELREALHLYDEMGASGHAERLSRQLGTKPESAARVA
jgi:tetratricopeptide (TPR) repeat protein